MSSRPLVRLAPLSMDTSSDGDKPIRWALICTETLFPMPVIRLITEDRIPAWEDFGWTVLARDTTIRFADLEDVRREDERGLR